MIRKVAIELSDPEYPPQINQGLSATAPPKLSAIGNLRLLRLPKTALFCSARCPGHAILKTYDQAARWRDAGHCVVSGFHSPVEKECLQILLRGASPVIICPARGLPRRLPEAWGKPLAAGRMLILSIFPHSETRVTTDLAIRRNEFVAALADDVWFAHVTPGGQLEKLASKYC